jgi:hypothetical protein
MWWRVFWFEAQNRQLQFCDLDFKITVVVSWFRPENHEGFNLSVVPQNRWEDATAWNTCRDIAACFT